jgi:hypothetical protein
MKLRWHFALFLLLLVACTQSPSSHQLSPQVGSWQDAYSPLGNSFTGLSDIVLDSNGSPVVAWVKGNSNQAQVSYAVNGAWVLLPEPAREPSRLSILPSVDTRSDNRPVVAYVERYAENSLVYSNLYLRRWTGSSWVNVGGSLNFRKGYSVETPSIAIDKTGITPTNYPTVIWTEWNGTDYDVRATRRTVTGWQNLGLLDLNPGDRAWRSSLHLDQAGQPVAAFINQSVQGGNDVIGLYVKRWNGSSWQSYETGITPLNDVNKSLKSYAFTLDKNDRPVVAYIEERLVNNFGLYQARTLKIKRWNGIQWTTLLNEAYNYQYFTSALDSLDIAFDSLNQPVITYQRWNGTKNLVRAKYRDRTTGTWVVYGDVLNSNPPVYSDGQYPRILLQQGTSPRVAFNESGNISIKQWVP